MPTAPDTIALIMPPAEMDPHGTLRFATGIYGAAFEAIGRRTELFELSARDAGMIEALRSPRIEAVFSDGGWIHATQVAFGDTSGPARSLGDLVGKPSIVLISDSPYNQWMDPILGRGRANQTTVFIDPDFAAQWGRWADEVGAHQTYVPACPDLGAAPPESERSIGILVVASTRPPDFHRARALGRLTGDGVARLFDSLAEACLADGLRPFSAICDEALRSLDLRLDHKSSTARFLLCSVEQFVRNRRRLIMLERLADHPITLVGGGTIPRLHPDSRVMEPMPYPRLVECYRRARCVVVSPPYSGAITERLIHPMAAGAVVVAPPTSLGDRVLGRDRLYVTARADFADLGACLDRALDPKSRKDMADAALAEARRRFSPVATVRRFLGEPDG
ncbi:MAG: glycosyltransferase family 1 protein [Alphaproteobacteria bacterium]|nr:glycosyltransferase family 1 protein [Alphaproteobacteria bacterium]